jgi:predicted DNA-binding transcriptional regulator AlpA
MADREDSMLQVTSEVARERPQSSYSDDRVIMERDAADFLSVGQSTLQRWRQLGTGPRFVRLSARRLGYRLSDLTSFLREREHMTGAPQSAEG